MFEFFLNYSFKELKKIDLKTQAYFYSAWFNKVFIFFTSFIFFMPTLKLYMLLLGCTPKSRHTEQHDLFFTVANSLKETIPHIHQFWPDGGSIHIDAWREITETEGYTIQIVHKNEVRENSKKLFFINLGGYKPGEFEEYHYKLLAIGQNKGEAIAKAKKTAFYKHTGFKGAASHIDFKYGIDVDDLYEIKDILPIEIKEKYAIQITKAENIPTDEWHLGYTILSKLT